ncbi:helix-turn-helix transcriptional regulator [Rhizobium sp. LEGMi198b]
MADTLRLSMRQVQRSFASLGTTPTKYLLIKRLEHARKEIDQIIAGRRVELISTIAFEAGFSDLSYFQRTFRRAFGNTPRDYLSGIAERVHIGVEDSATGRGP